MAIEFRRPVKKRKSGTVINREVDREYIESETPSEIGREELQRERRARRPSARRGSKQRLAAKVAPKSRRKRSTRAA